MRSVRDSAFRVSYTSPTGQHDDLRIARIYRNDEVGQVGSKCGEVEVGIGDDLSDVRSLATLVLQYAM